MKGSICTVIGAIGGGIAVQLSGLAVFGLAHSTGNHSGCKVNAHEDNQRHQRGIPAAEKHCNAGWYGLAKKGSILMLIIVAVRLDILLNTNYVRDAVCIAFCVNELLSIVENTSLMGIPYPPALKNAIEVLQKQTGRKDDKDD